MAKRKAAPSVEDLLGPIEQLVLTAALRLGDEAYGMSVFDAIRTAAYPAISFGSVYTTLERLTWKGYLESFIGEPQANRGGRARKYFRVTGIGKQVLEGTQETLRRATLIESTAGVR